MNEVFFTAATKIGRVRRIFGVAIYFKTSHYRLGSITCFPRHCFTHLGSQGIPFVCSSFIGHVVMSHLFHVSVFVVHLVFIRCVSDILKVLKTSWTSFKNSIDFFVGDIKKKKKMLRWKLNRVVFCTVR